MTNKQAIEEIEKFRARYLFRPGTWFEKDQAYQRSISRGVAELCIERLEDHPGENPTVILWRMYEQYSTWYENADTLREWHFLATARGAVKDILELFT
jgi:hypothetical protein